MNSEKFETMLENPIESEKIQESRKKSAKITLFLLFVKYTVRVRINIRVLARMLVGTFSNGEAH